MAATVTMATSYTTSGGTTENDLVAEVRNAVPAGLLVDVPSLIRV